MKDKLEPVVLLSSGNYFNFEEPDKSTFTIDDIATGLSNICRFNGQCNRFYSVAEHSVHVSRLVPEHLALEALFHDAAEAIIGDISTPLKQFLPDFKRIEAAVEKAIFDHIGISSSCHEIIKHYDTVMLLTERDQLMKRSTENNVKWPSCKGDERAEIDLSEELLPKEAKLLFMTEAIKTIEGLL